MGEPLAHTGAASHAPMEKPQTLMWLSMAALTMSAGLNGEHVTVSGAAGSVDAGPVGWRRPLFVWVDAGLCELVIVRSADARGERGGCRLTR